MNLIYSEGIYKLIKSEILRTIRSIYIISAYCKYQALEEINNKIDKSVQIKKLLVGFKLGDILSSATDIGIYEFCKKHGWGIIYSKLCIFLVIQSKLYL